MDTKAFIMFSDLIKQFYEVKSDTLKVLNLKLSHLKILHLLSDHNGINQQEIAVISASKRSTISEIISEMESEDLVMRIGNDKRPPSNEHLPDGERENRFGSYSVGIQKILYAMYGQFLRR